MLDSQFTADGRLHPADLVRSAGPAAPTAGAISALRPLDADAVQLAPQSLLGQWQARNSSATLPHCIEQLDRSGALGNIRDQGADDGRPHVGMWFADSDVHKTLEAVAWELARPQSDSRLRDFLDATATLLASAQQADGYLNSYFTRLAPEKRWRELHWSHELYCAGHLFQAAVAASRVGVGEPLVGVARRFADLLVEVFGPGGTDGVCGHPEVETALVELYRTTGYRPYLDLARRFVDLRGRGLLDPDRFGPVYFQDHLPVRDADRATGHAVRQLYLLAGMVDVAVECGDTTLLDAATRLWDDIFSSKTYITGGHGSRHRDEAFGDPYELPPDRAYAETCAAIASFQWNWRMLLATGRARYADEMERVLYNGIAGATALDGRHFFYSNPLHLRTGHDGSEEDAPSQRLPWYSCSCCPPNLARLMAALQAYVATTDPGGLQLHLLTAGRVRASLHGQAVEVSIETGYPWDGRLGLAVTSGSAEPWTLAVRIPGWAAGVDVEVDGAPVAADVRDGYLRITRDWSVPAPVTVRLPMPPRLVTAHPRVDAVRGCVALLRGPLVYCLEQADLPSGVTLEDVRLVEGARLTPVDCDDTGPAPVVVTAPGVLRNQVDTPLYADAAAPDAPGTEIGLTAVPYFRWGNRAAGAMRVWIPTEPPRPGPTDSGDEERSPRTTPVS